MNHTLLELQLLNAAIDSGDPYYLTKLGVDKSWFPTYEAAHTFITRYVRENGEMPTLTTVVGSVEGFDFVEFESPETLKKRLGDILAKREFREWLKTVNINVPFPKIKETIDRKSREIETKFGVKVETASNWRTNGEQRFANYVDRESNKRMLIPSGFNEINKALTGKDAGAFTKGDYIVFYGKTKRGKSHLVRKTATIPAARAGYRVLDLALENEREEIEFMIDSIESADSQVMNVEVNGVKTAGGFDRKKLQYGYLDKTQRELYRAWTDKFNQENSSYGDYIVKTFEDDDMETVDIRKIESLIDEHEPDVLLVDPIYLTTYPRVSDKTPGSGAQAMSRALRKLATRKGVIVIVTVQADVRGSGGKDDDDDEDKLGVPPISKVKTSMSLIEDGTVTFGIDSLPKGGKAIIEIMLSRKGGAGSKVDLQYLPQFGIVRSMSEAIKKQMEIAEATKLF